MLPTPTPEQAAAMAQAALAADAEIWTYMILGWLITIVRTYGRVQQGGWRNMRADDYFAWVAAIFYALESGAAYASGAVAQGLANNGIPEAHRASLTPDDPEYQMRVIGSKIQLMGWSTYSVMVWCLKASLLCFYLRLASRTSGSYRMRVFIGLGLVACSWLAVFLTIFCECVPFHKNWQIYPDPGSSCNPSSSENILWVSITMNIMTDAYIMVTPIPMLWQSSLRPAKKVALIGLFSCGIFVIACALVRTTLMLKDPVNSAAIAGLWSCRETFVATFATNLPAIFPLIKTWSGKLFTTVSESMGSSTRNTGHMNKLSGGDTHDTFGARSGKSSGKSSDRWWNGSNNNSSHNFTTTMGTTTYIGRPDDEEAAISSSHGNGEKNIKLNYVQVTSTAAPVASPSSSRAHPSPSDGVVVPQSPLSCDSSSKRPLEE